MSDGKKTDKVQGFLDKLPIIKKLKSIKHIEIIIFVIFLLIAFLIMFGGSNIFSFGSTSFIQETASTSYTYFSTSAYLRDTENNLKTILQGIDGAGEVNVMISAKSAGEIVYATNTEEITTTDKNSNVITTKNETIIFTTKDGVSQPLVLKEILPEISGVVIVAKGASDTKVKLNIITATQTLLGISSDLINVFS